MKLAAFALAWVVAIAGCAPSRTAKPADVYSRLAGNWDEQAEDQCKAPQAISFDDRRTTMLITYADVGWVSDTDSRKVFRYRILEARESSLRMQLENEPRLDATGKPVVWHVVLLDDDKFCWGRDDWPQGSCTPPRTRCPG